MSGIKVHILAKLDSLNSSVRTPGTASGKCHLWSQDTRGRSPLSVEVASLTVMGILSIVEAN